MSEFLEKCKTLTVGQVRLLNEMALDEPIAPETTKHTI